MKYTGSGSIVVELDGQPKMLSIKISDSGCGIEPEAFEQIFQPGGSDQRSRAVGSYGLGLSVVVRLLAHIGGRLEVMSKPQVGTTFWVFVPVKPEQPVSLEESLQGVPRGSEDGLADVVRI
ncbi:MAG: ATP-binding protein, partial [Deltaproteobacteria bacterium]|nr:ATP-binding protein [Deltaproteobacteria bacterium]